MYKNLTSTQNRTLTNPVMRELSYRAQCLRWFRADYAEDQRREALETEQDAYFYVGELDYFEIADAQNPRPVHHYLEFAPL